MIKTTHAVGAAATHAILPPISSLKKEGAQGIWHGHTLTRLSGAGNPATSNAAYLHGSGLPPVQSRPVTSRRVSPEAAVKPMPVPEMFFRAATLGVNAGQLRSAGRSILRGEFSKAATGRSAGASRLLSLRLAAACLEEGVDDSRLLALITPVDAQPQNSEDMARLLQEAGDDPEELKKVLRHVLPGQSVLPQNAVELFHALKNVRFEPDKLMVLLGKAQGLPPAPELRAQLRQKIHDEIREFESSNKDILADINAAHVAASTDDPANFLETYQKLLQRPAEFHTVLKLLLARYPVDGIAGALADLKKALSEDLSSVTPSQDPTRLGTILSELSHMHLSTTLIEMVKGLVDSLRRIPHANPAG